MVKKPSGELQIVPLILMDRDGVLCDNRSNGIRSYSKFKLVPGLSKSLKKLGSRSLRVGIITNQPDISRGLLRRSELKKMNDAIIRAARKAGIGPERMTIKVCPHTNEDDCDCRKPKTGLIDRVMKEFGLRPGTTRFYIIGDKLTDLQTLENYYRQELLPRGIPRKSMTTILLEWEYGDQSSERRFMTVGNARVVPDFRLGSLESAVNLIMGLERGGPERKS